MKKYKTFELGKDKLPKKFKEKWVTALRSGKYKQDKKFSGYLITKKETYCCLGVACEISKVKTGNHDMIFGIKGINKIPLLLQGTNKQNPNCLAVKLAKMNDSGKSFKIIANWIDKNL